MDIKAKEDANGIWEAKIVGDRRDPRPIGKGKTWQEAVRDLTGKDKPVPVVTRDVR